MLYNPPSGSSDANAPYVGKNTAAGTQGSKVPPGALEYTQREIVAAIAASGQSPTNNVLVQLAMAVSRGVFIGNLTGTGDLSVATMGVVFPSLLQGMKIGAVSVAANATAAPKLRVMNLGTVGAYQDFPILKEDGNAPAIGEIKAARRYRYEADGAGNVIISGGGIGQPAIISGPGFTLAAAVSTLAYLTADQSVFNSPGGAEYAVSWAGVQGLATGVWSAAQPTRLYIPAGIRKIRVQFVACFEVSSTGSRKARILLNGVQEGNGLPADRKPAAGNADVTLDSGPGGTADITVNLTSGTTNNPDGTNYVELRLVQDSGGALNVRKTNSWCAVDFLA